jgi:hypothetical protein
VGFDVTDQQLIRFYAFVKYWRNNGVQTVHHLLIDFKKTYYSVRKKVLYNFLIEFGVLMKLVRLIKTCLHETYTKERIGKHLSDSFPIRNGLKQGDTLSPLLLTLFYNMPLGRSRKPGGTEIEWETSASGLC